LIDYVPVWLMAQPNGAGVKPFKSPAIKGGNDLLQATVKEDAVFTQYLTILADVLTPQLQAVAAEQQQRGAQDTGKPHQGTATNEPIDHAHLVQLLVKELGTRARFDTGLASTLKLRDQRQQSGACPDPSTTWN
jgi:hypothetical protein